jgi:DNA (cytosine-5)-methyltransferase 1
MREITVGSVCSGIEAASVAWHGLGFHFKWLSEIAEFPSKVLDLRHPGIPNLGDMSSIPTKLREGWIEAPDLICGGTPCQAFSLAGWKKGLDDDRGNLTLKFVDIVDENDRVRSRRGLCPALAVWENVEGVLRDRTNAFGCFLASLAGLDSELSVERWPRAGVLRGPKRNVAWRVLDAKYFGVPQQRRRLYVVAGGPDFFPEGVLFERAGRAKGVSVPEFPLCFTKEGRSIEVFRAYTDCLYSAYGTKWNGNAAAYNGSLFVCEEGRLRRFTPLECERLMGFPDNYTDLIKAKPTSRYQSIGNSWAVPVVRWLGKRLANRGDGEMRLSESDFGWRSQRFRAAANCALIDLSEGLVPIGGELVNCAEHPSEAVFGDLSDVIEANASEQFYITPVGCKGILRRKSERGLSMNLRLEQVLGAISAKWSDAEIDLISRRQSRGRFAQCRTQHPELGAEIGSLFGNV